MGSPHRNLWDDKLIRLPKRVPRARNLRDPDHPERFEFQGDELAMFVLRPEGGSIWLSQDVCTRAQLNYVLEFVDHVRAKLLGLRDAS